MNASIAAYIESLCQKAKAASRLLSQFNTADKNKALLAIADALQSQVDALYQANQKDLEAGKAKGLDSALLDRLAITPSVIEGMVASLEQVARLPDPVGEITGVHARPSGIHVGKMRVPIGVIAIIYESRPNVTIEAASLCLKSGNATILRGGSESIHSNQALAKCIQAGLKEAGITFDAIQVVERTDREAVGALIKSDAYVDVIVPRGGQGLIERVSAESTIPVIKHLHGICHVYIDDQADKDKAIKIAINAKTQRYGTCNTMESLLIAKNIAATLLPELKQLYDAKGVELRGCPQTCDILTDIGAATDEDWATEYLAPILSIKMVDSLDDAIHHINKYGSGHTDAIVTQDYTKARRFLTEVDSSSVMINASTRFADGFEYGLGAEIGISTNKLHARGPVGLEGLTTQKFVVYGDGHIRE